MSSLRNAVKRITHKERSQPSSRQNLGLLEKKSDYRLRSQDYHKKSNRLKSMRTKAANRNPDEFYFGMHKSKVDGMSGNNTGRHVKTAAARNEEGLDFDTVRVMKDQDLAYIRMKRMMDAKKIERLQSSLHYLEDDDNGDDDDSGLGRKKKKMTNKRKHTVFVEGGQEEVQQFDLAQHFETHPDLISRAFNRPRITTLEGGAQKMDEKRGDDDDDEYDDDEDSNSPHSHRPPPSAKQQLKAERKQRKFERSIAKARSGAYTEMEMRIERMNKLKAAEERLISEQHANAKGRKRKINGDDNDDDGGGKKPAVYKWRRKRAR